MTVYCESQSHGEKKPSAKVVALQVVRQPDKRLLNNSLSRSLAESRQAAIDSGKLLQASDGNWVGLGLGLCGTHVKTVRPTHSVPAINVDSLGGKDAELSIKYALSVYEQDLIKEAARKDAEAQRWHEHSIELAKEPVILDTPKVGEANRYGYWSVELINATSGKGVATVSIDLDGGIGRLHISDYGGNVGLGRGNLSYVRALQQALTMANEVMVKNYRENGLEV